MPTLAHAARSPQPDHVLSKALLRAAERMALTQKDVSRIIGVSPATISRLSRRPLVAHSKSGELAVLLVRLFRSLDSLFGGNEEVARQWLHARNQHLDGVPAEKIQNVTGLLHVLEYLDAMRGKV